MKSFKNKRAFTLVELIIVIAVIGVLAAILIPTFANVIEKANRKSALSDAKNALQIAIAEMTDGTGGTPIGEGSVFKVRKANKDWYFTYYDNGLHEGDGSENADIHYPDFTKPDGAILMMNEDSVYIDEQDYDSIIINEIPTTVVIYNTGDTGSYTPPADLNAVIPITEASQLTTEFFSTNGWNRKYRVENDITLTGNFSPIEGTFKGVFDGNGKTISGMNVEAADKSEVGFFTKFDGEMKDLTLGISNMKGGYLVGGICTETSGGKFTNVHVVISGLLSAYSDDPTLQHTATGFCCMATGAEFSRCSVMGDISSRINEGGLIGCAISCTISESFYKGNFVLKDNDIASGAGLVFRSEQTRIENCYANANIKNEGIKNPIVSFAGLINYLDYDETECTNCIVVCAVENPETMTLEGGTLYFSAISSNPITATNCYALESDCLVNRHTERQATLIESFSQANCPGLSTVIWSFAGAYPTLINNAE